MSDPSPRRTVARHARLTSPHPLGQIARLVAVALAVVFVSTAGTAAFAAWNAVDTATSNSVTLEGERQLPPEIGEIEGGVNLLMVGTDSCEGQSVKKFPRCAHDDGGERNDVTMLVHISDSPRRVTVVSFPRDMLVDIPSCPDGNGGRYGELYSTMINASYGRGGLNCTALTVTALTGMQIDFAAAIRWTGVINMSDAIGGVRVCLTGDIDNRDTGLHLKKGSHVLKGEEALQFLRIRKGIGDGSDLGRISNQQQFMSSLVRKLKSDEVLSNPATLFALANTALQQVNNKQLVLSDNLANPTRMVQIAMALKDVDFDDIVFVQYPTQYAGSSRVVPLVEPAQVLFDALTDNKPITLTGEASPGYSNSQTVKGEATPSESAAPDESPTPGASASSTTEADAAVELPDVITGQTASQKTCTNPQTQ
ncbi:MAG: LCP family protein [Microbacterium sp.]|uniref:LCP family protein n=1 Tax=Microbacterium sp. TaxID=51671 RepID=UPI0039E26240